MCITVGTSTPHHRGRVGQLWWQLTDNPLQLFGAAALLHLALLVLLVSNTAGTGHDRLPAIATGTLALTLFGAIFRYFPRWASRSPVHYLRYMGTFFALLVGLFLLEWAPQAESGLLLLGKGLLLIGLWLPISTMAEYLPWIPAGKRQAAAIMRYSAYLLGLSLIAGLTVFEGAL